MNAIGSSDLSARGNFARDGNQDNSCMPGNLPCAYREMLFREYWHADTYTADMNSLKFTDELGGDDLQTLNIDSFGVPKPVSIYVETFGAEHQDISFIEACVREDCDLTPKGIIQSIELGDVDDNKVSSLGPFGKAGLSREEGAMKAPHRIDTVIDAVREAWKTVPDWRLEQMIVNIIWSAGKMDPFFLEDDDLLKAMGEQPTER